MKRKRDDLKYCIIYFLAALLTLIFWVAMIVYIATVRFDTVMLAIIIIMSACFVFFTVCGILFLGEDISRRK